MVFSSLEFLYLFLPPVLLGFILLRRLNWEAGVVWWLIGASLAFYAVWSPIHLLLLLGSVGVNYGLYKLMMVQRSRAVLVFGIVLNLAALGYFKYADFFIENVNLAFGADLPALNLLLPLAISFFTFQQISFLVDAYKGEAIDAGFPKYMLFVVFFPQLIAGPIVLQKDTIPQFRLSVFQSRLAVNLAVGGTLLAIGLFKKIVLADGVAPYATGVFSLADAGEPVPMEAWMGALAYTFQIYFDFSGYCDMAIGLARMFGIVLPANFNSPYKATSISDFWRRWHMTLSRFLRDYLYIALGGNRRGESRRYANLMMTMVLGGLWHGASWNFVIWGFLHGLFLAVCHAWAAVLQGAPRILPRRLNGALAQALTLLAVIVAWVFFRAETTGGAIRVLEGMFGLGDVADAKTWRPALAGALEFWPIAAALGLFVLIAPNALEITRRYRPVLDIKALSAGASRWARSVEWRPSLGWTAATAVIALAAIIQIYRLGDLTEFIYFNF